MRVLVVDNEAINRLIIVEMLTSVGIEVVEAGDAATGLDLMRTSPFSMVFMDIRMPGVDGLEATRRIRALPGARSQVPVIVVTGDVTDECTMGVKAAGADRVLHKPVVLEQLLRTVADTITATDQAVLA